MMHSTNPPADSARRLKAKLHYRTLVVLVAFVGLLLSACKTELHSDLDETDANEMISVLARYDIESSKSTGRSGTFTVTLDNSKVAPAVDVLRRHGLPRRRFHSMGEVFRKKGLISSPLEERARFVYALQENLQETLSQIDGVIVARVHVVLPENNPFADESDKASSASVFIKHAADHDLSDLRSEIKMIVGNSIQGLTYKDVTVTLVAAKRDGSRDRNMHALPADAPAVASRSMPVALSVFLILVGLWVARACLRTYLRRRITPAVGGAT